MSLEKSERWFRALVDSAPDSILIVDKDGRIAFVNERIESLFGYRPQELIGQELEVLVADDLREKHRALVRSYLQSAVPRPMGKNRDLMGRHKDGHLVAVDISLSPSTEADDFFVVAIVRDVTDRRQFQRTVEQKLSERAEELQRSNRLLEEFASVASHDLKAPARRAAMFLQLFAKDYCPRLDGKSRELLELAVSETMKMQATVDDLLVYSSVCAVRPELKPISLIKVVSETLELLKPEIEEKRAKVTIGFLPKVMGNELQLRRLFSNLVLNALKFNRGTPRVHLSSAETADGYVVSVADNGVGVPEGQAQKIFELFHRAHSDREFNGTGVGLASCKRIMENHAGQISAVSQPGHGATFSLTFPLAAEKVKSVPSVPEARELPPPPHPSPVLREPPQTAQ